MLYKPCQGEQVYQISVYNRVVRSLVKENQSHELYNDHWADSQRHDVVARDETEARSMISERFDIDDGFGDETVAVNTIKLLENNSCSAVMLEDQKRPRLPPLWHCPRNRNDTIKVVPIQLRH